MASTKLFKTDVLVIGGGLSGLRAAITARRFGKKVLLTVKGKLGRSGSSVLTDGGYAAVTPDAEKDTPATHVEDTWESGRRIAELSLVQRLCHHSYNMLCDLEAMGSRFLKEDDQRLKASSGDHAFPRILLAVNQTGRDLTDPLAAHCRRTGVDVLESTMAIKLLDDGIQVLGAACLDLTTGDLIIIQASATILATGGSGNLFSRTSNPNDVTGDGFALAWRSGAQLRDMEFIQFYPWRLIEPNLGGRMLIQPETFVLGATLYNNHNEAFMKEYAPIKRDAATRDIVARAIADQVLRGRGINGGVRLDLSPLSSEELQKSNPHLSLVLADKNINFRDGDRAWIVAPEAHYMMGGVAINDKGHTSKPGLFAAGEVTGGIHGANRLDSNSLPDTQVFGHLAGLAAVERTETYSGSASFLTSEKIMELEALITQRLNPQSNFDPRNELHKLQQQMTKSLGLIRSGGQIRQGFNVLEDITLGLKKIRVSSLHRLRQLFELEFLCDVACLSLTSAWLREESRGAHFRADFPEMNDKKWATSIFLGRSPSGEVSYKLSADGPTHTP